MAKQVITTLIDDLTGGAADQTLTFAFDGVTYEIDLSERNADKFRAMMTPYVQAGTRVTKASGPGVRYHQPVQPNQAQAREENNRIRDWAAKNGYTLADRGRIPLSVMDAYKSNTPNPTQVAVNAARARTEASNGARRSAGGKRGTLSSRTRVGAVTFTPGH